MNPSDDKDIVKYKTDNALDSDVIATQKHFKAEEKQQGHSFDPVKFLAQTKDQDMDYENAEQMAQHEQMANEDPAAALGELASAPQSAPPTAIAQEKSHHKSAVKSKAKVQAKAKTEAKTKAQTHAEKMNAFVSMRKKMMSNWGTKWKDEDWEKNSFKDLKSIHKFIFIRQR